MKKMLLLLCSSCCLLTFSCKQAGDAVIEKLLKNQADALNKNGGTMLDSETRMDSIGVKSGRRLVYYYTLVNYTREQLDTNVIKQSMVPNIKKIVIENADLKPLRDKDVDFYHIYRDKRGKYCFSIDVPPSDYNKK